MYVLLLPAITAMHVTLESDQSQASANKMMKEDQLEHLKASYEKLKTERDQLQASYNNLATERDQLQDKVKEITKEKDKLEAHFILTRVLLARLQKEKDGLQKSFTDPEVGDETMMVDFPEHKSWKAAISEMELAPSRDSALDGDSLTIEFPEHKSWKGLVSEMELASSADSGYFRVGDRVRVKASVNTPKYEWGDASHKSVAINGEKMTVDFPEHKSWNGLVSEMELAPSADQGYFRIGDRVRVKPSVNTPKYEWGHASHKSVGVVKAINGESMTVDFPEHESWKAAVSEMELAPSADLEIFRVGDRVRVKASVSTPKYKWGGASHNSVGVVSEIDGESLTVHFPEHTSWNGIVSEMELLPSAYSALKMVVDFPEHSDWNADASDMELAP
ncbi:hypothetical protein SRHO_G00066400 [Serrasalmus rhombeus]